MTSPNTPCPNCGHIPAHNEPRAFTDLRTILITLTAFACAGVVGVLTYLMNHNVPGAVLAGFGTLGAVIVALHLLLG
jgi:cyanate permease